jgi:hypothetical protein
VHKRPFRLRPVPFTIIMFLTRVKRYVASEPLTAWLGVVFTLALAWFTYKLQQVASTQTEILAHTDLALNLAATAQTASAQTAEKLRLFTEAAERAWIGPINAAIVGQLEGGKPITAAVAYLNTGKQPAPLIAAGILRRFSKAEWSSAAARGEILAFEQDCMSKPMPGFSPTNIAYPNTGAAIYRWSVGSNDPVIEDKDRFVATDEIMTEGLFALLGCFIYNTAKSTHHSSFCFYYEGKESDPKGLSICLIGQNAD